MLNVLPPELVLHVLSTLDLISLRAVKLLSKAWSAFFAQHGDVIYRSAAVTHGFVAAGPWTEMQPERVKKAFATDWMDGARSWEDICRCFVRLERAWGGSHSQPSHLEIKESGPRAHRFKVIPEDRILVLTVGTAPYLAKVQRGNLLSIDIQTHNVLWSLPTNRVRALAHCEYDAGFLVFDRQGNALEVWRRAAAVAAPDVEPGARPDESMLLAAQEAFRADAVSPRGVFVPHALLQVPAPAWAYHVVGTRLVVASQIARSAFVYDVERGLLLETLDLNVPGSNWDEIHYVDMDVVNRRVFIATHSGVYVYSNIAPRGGTALVAHVSAFNPDTCIVYTLHEHSHPHLTPLGQALYRRLQLQRIITPNDDLFHFERCSLIVSAEKLAEENNILAAHVSPCGLHLAMLLPEALVVVRDYMEPSSQAHVLRMPDEGEVDYFAFDGKHIAVGMSRGLVVTNPELDSAVWLRPRTQTHEFSCVQLTAEAVWYTWGQPGPGLRFPASVFCCNFGANV